jgi:hypothetical protein
MPPDELRQSAV